MSKDFEVVKDKYGHVVCHINYFTGVVRSKYKGAKSETTLTVGGKVKFGRNKMTTTICRVREDKYVITILERDLFDES